MSYSDKIRVNILFSHSRSLFSIGPGWRWVVAALLSVPVAAEAYVGPGAGFAFLTSFLVLFVTIWAAFLSILTWPIRYLIRKVRRRRRMPTGVKRVIVVGLDGMEPTLAEDYLKRGLLPNLQRLSSEGCYSHLKTSFPAISPVAWSSFSTGCQPGRHNIFDFLDRDPRSYLPVLSSAHIGGPRRILKLGKFRIPLSKPDIRLMRKSKPFWTILGEYGLWSTVLRVPITFPPERFYGAQLSAMCVPDLRGTQGTFTLYTSEEGGEAIEEGGVRVRVEVRNRQVSTHLVGPPNSLVADNPELRLPLTVRWDNGKGKVHVKAGGEKFTLRPREYSDWIRLSFKTGLPVKVRGLARFYIPHIPDGNGKPFHLYVTPISIDPESPAMPISHPGYYATYLAKLIGPYATLGLAEDTWGLSEGAIDEAAFLKQAYDIHEERVKMFFEALKRLREGSLVCVFDITDRLQHMFWRFLEPDHPANHRDKGRGHEGAIEEMYRRMDHLVGRVMAKLGADDVLFVISDHGFKSFRRGVNLNSWLWKNGYLALKDGANVKVSRTWLRDVDWSRTRAYAMGLGGMYLNIRGRESEGIVEPGEQARELKREIIAKLDGLKDEERGKIGINKVFDSAEIYRGPYRENAPDMILGYNVGYRVSWKGATGVVNDTIFDDNTKAWSGDHSLDPRLVPGVMFSNRKFPAPGPALMDLAPTILELFGIRPPVFMDGKSLLQSPGKSS